MKKALLIILFSSFATFCKSQQLTTPPLANDTTYGLIYYSDIPINRVYNLNKPKKSRLRMVLGWEITVGYGDPLIPVFSYYKSAYWKPILAMRVLYFYSLEP